MANIDPNYVIFEYTIFLERSTLLEMQNDGEVYRQTATHIEHFVTRHINRLLDDFDNTLDFKTRFVVVAPFPFVDDDREFYIRNFNDDQAAEYLEFQLEIGDIFDTNLRFFQHVQVTHTRGDETFHVYTTSDHEWDIFAYHREDRVHYSDSESDHH